MSSEQLFFQESLQSVEMLLKDPPKIILVFDHEGVKKKDDVTRLGAKLRGDVAGSVGQDVSNNVMDLRAAVAALIYHSSLYDGKEKPKVCCFAGPHEPGGKAGSAAVKEHLLKFGIDPKDIITRETTITTKFDIMQLFAFMVGHNINGPVAIVTTDGHIARTEQEIKNNRTFKVNPDKHKIYVFGPSSKELRELPYPQEKLGEMRERLRGIELLKEKDPGGGLTEKIAYILSVLSANSWMRTHVQTLAEHVSHPDFPPELVRIEKRVGLRK